MEIKLSLKSTIFILNNIIPVFISVFWVRFNQKIVYAKELNIKGEFLREYYLLIDLQNEKLMASEKFQLDLNMAKLFYDVGNHYRFFLLMDKLLLENEKYPKENFFFRLLNSFYYELKDDYKSAKVELEYIVENTDKNDSKIQAYNNLARIEMIQKKSLSAEISFLKSFELLKLEPLPYFFPSVVHNLLMSYAKNNDINNGDKLLEEYWGLVNKNSSQQINDYSNDMIHYARQTNNQELLNKAYALIDEKVYILANNSEKFMLDISKLRMSYNDNINFEKNYKETFTKIKLKKEYLSLEEKLLVIQELKHILTQHYHNNFDNKNILDDLKWLSSWHISLEKDIVNKLTSIESSLPSIKIYWFNKLMDMNKTKIMFLDNNEDFYPYFEKIMLNLDESISVWKDVENEKEYIRKTTLFFDELCSFYFQTRDRRLIKSYRADMINKCTLVENLLEQNWNKSGYEDSMVAIAWFSWHIKNDRQLAMKWINRFDNLNHSLNHYAEFINMWYLDTKKWLSTPLSQS